MAISTAELKPLLSAREAAPLMGVALQTLYNWMHLGKDIPPYIVCGRRVRFHPDDIAAWLEARRCDGQVRAVLPQLEREVSPPPMTRRPGRPTKAEAIARRDAASVTGAKR
ncbi:helix-turn-helix domain-containing protein [Castellaniella caeni]